MLLCLFLMSYEGTRILVYCILCSQQPDREFSASYCDYAIPYG